MTETAIPAKNQALSRNSTPKNKFRKQQSRQLSELVNGLVAPILQRKAGMTLDLIAAWPEIAGPEFAETTKPEKLKWPRRNHEDEPFTPASIVIACEPAAALFLQHEQAQILSRINLFFGFNAVDRIQIRQKQVLNSRTKKDAALKPKQPLNRQKTKKLQTMLDHVEDEKLKATLARLGSGILSRQPTK